MPRPAQAKAAAKPRRRYAPRMAPEQRREQLLDAALRVTVEEGYAGVSIEAIARAAGVTRPVIYDHFENLGKLLQALLAREERYANAQLGDAIAAPSLEGTTELPQMLSAIVRRFLEAVLSRPLTWQLILLASDGMPAIVHAHVEAQQARVIEQLQPLLATAGHRLGAELDVELAARAVLGFAWDAGRLALTDPQAYTPERFESFVAQFAEGVGRTAAS